MYFGRGFALNEIGDCHVIEHEGRLHLFHVAMPSHDIVAHLVSDDALNWRPVAHAIRVGDPGECDDDQIWTMSVFRWEGRFYMLYTALASAEDGAIQRAAVAVSDDLMRWEKVATNPVAAPDPRWYESDTTGCGRADWRDPFGWVEGDTIHALVCAHENHGPQNRRGCIGYFTSKDALNWEVKPPFYSPGLASDWEVPALMKLGERYYLLGHTCAPSQDIYRYADSLAGPWHRPLNDWILPKGAHIFTPVAWQGRTLLYHWLEAPFDWPDRRRVTGPANATRAIAPPKEAVALENGEMVLRSCDFVWQTVAGAIGSPSVSQDDLKIGRGEWNSDGWTVEGKSLTGMGVCLLRGEFADFRVETTITLGTAREAGFFWRADDETEEGTFFALIPGHQRIELQRLVAQTPGEPRRLGRGFKTLQENYLSVASGQKFKLRVIAWGPYIEISLDDRVLLCYMTMSRRQGRIGFFTNDGTATFGRPQLTELTPPGIPECALEGEQTK